MNEYYIMFNGNILAGGFPEYEKAEKYAKMGGFHGSLIIKIINYIE